MDTRPAHQHERGGGGTSLALAAAAADDDTDTPSAVLFLGSPADRCAQSRPPALNLSASILILLSFYLTWQIRARALRLASSNVHAHLMGAIVALATALARQ